MKRRVFLKAGALACLAGIAPLTACTSEDSRQDNSRSQSAEGGQSGKRYGFVVDVEKLSKDGLIDKITAVCHKSHNVPVIEDPKTSIEWIWEEDFEHTFPELNGEYLGESIKKMPFAVMCNHCDEPPCVRVCPTQATFKRSDGVVSMDYHRCIGCRFCMGACPYGARSLNFSDPKPYIEEIDPAYPTRSKGVVEKCMLCSERIDQGEVPLCAEASEGAIMFGDLSDENSAARKALDESFSIRRRIELGTGPSVYYLIKGGEGRA